MQTKTLFAAAAALLATGANAMGTATVINNCGFPVYYASVGGGANPAMQQLQGSYSQAFGTAISIKLSTQDDISGPITQFEFSLGGGKIAYDMSNINGNPFAQYGMDLVPSMQGDASNPTCVPVTCPAGQATCSAAYNQPDDVRTMVCNEDSSLTLTLCDGGSAKRSIADAGREIIQRFHARHFPSSA